MCRTALWDRLCICTTLEEVIRRTEVKEAHSSIFVVGFACVIFSFNIVLEVVYGRPYQQTDPVGLFVMIA